MPRATIILELETNTGLRGLGEISDLEDAWQAPSPETLCETLTPLLAGADPCKRLGAWERVAEALPASYHTEFRRLVCAAVEMALIDLAGKYYNAPASRAFRRPVPGRATHLLGRVHPQCRRVGRGNSGKGRRGLHGLQAQGGGRL